MSDFSTPPGWYPDGDGWERRWTGDGWSDERRRMAEPTQARPLPPPPPAAPAGPPPVAPPPYAAPPIAPPPYAAPSYGQFPGPGSAPPQRRRSRAGLWISLGLVLVVLVGAGVTLAVLAPWKDDGGDKGAGGGTGTDPTPVASAVRGDVDGDGLGDAIYYFARTYDDVAEVTAISDGTAFELSEVAINDADRRNLLFLDGNGDGVTDQLAWDFVASGDQLTLSGDGAGFPAQQRFTVTVSSLAEYGNQGLEVVDGDFDGDGDQDLAVAAQNQKAIDVSVLLNDGTGTFAAPALWLALPNAVLDSSQIWGGDFDGDGTADLWAQLPADRLSDEDYSGSYSGDTGYALLTSTGDSFSYGRISEIDSYIELLLVGDVTGDGTTSLVGVNVSSYDEEITITVYDPSSGVLEEVPGFTGRGDVGDRQLQSATLSDVDGDGRADIVFAVKSYDEREFTGIQVMRSTGAILEAPVMWAETPTCDDDNCRLKFVGDRRYYE